MDEVDVRLDGIADPPEPVLFREVLAPNAGVHLTERCLAVDTPTGLQKRRPRDIGGVHAQVAARLKPRLEREHHDRIGLLPARAAGRPDIEWSSTLVAAAQC